MHGVVRGHRHEIAELKVFDRRLAFGMHGLRLEIELLLRQPRPRPVLRVFQVVVGGIALIAEFAGIGALDPEGFPPGDGLKIEEVSAITRGPNGLLRG